MQRITSLSLVKPGHVLGRRRIIPPIGEPYCPDSSVVIVTVDGRPTSVLIHTDQGWN